MSQALIPTGDDLDRGRPRLRKAFVVYGNEQLIAFLEVEWAIRADGAIVLDERLRFSQTRRRYTDLNQAEDFSR